MSSFGVFFLYEEIVIFIDKIEQISEIFTLIVLVFKDEIYIKIRAPDGLDRSDFRWAPTGSHGALIRKINSKSLILIRLFDF